MKRSLALGLVASALLGCTVSLPDYPAPSRRVWLDQGWTPQERETFHHIDQGTLTFGIPYEWFVALEQPSSWPGETSRFADKTWLDRFGYIPGESSLPVGFAHSSEFRDASGQTWTNPGGGEKLTGIGLTCAACHTGRITYRGTELLIDGGSALTNVVALNEALALALHKTQDIPTRFDRFAARVLGPNAGEPARIALRAQMASALIHEDKVAALETATAPGSPTEGFGRLDALNRIGNQVFGIDMDEPSNYAPRSAPVHYPHIWTAPWFTWVQYNGSIMQPMIRNAGEAMGVGAYVNLSKDGPDLYDSTIHIPDLYWAEQVLAGQPPHAAKSFTGLRAPAWPDALPPIDRTRAEKGSALYQQLCQHCHLPAPNTTAFWTGAWWKPINNSRDTYLDLHQIPITEVGTDPEQAAGMIRRTVKLRSFTDLGSTSFPLALGAAVEKVTSHWYDSQTPPVIGPRRAAMNGGRPNLLQAKPEYKARPLNGIWAVPPYLHNGSVPNLYALLSPLVERPVLVFLADREYDPILVGYRGAPINGGFALDTTLPGNRNIGHLFTDDTGASGRIGRALSPDERMDLIEYLKTL